MLLYPIDITATNKTLYVYEDTGSGGVSIPVTLTEGTYWAYRNQFSTDWPSLYDHLEAKINAACTNAYTVQIATPSQSSSRTNWGIKLVRSGGTATFGLDTNQGGFDYRMLGFNPGIGTPIQSGGELVGSLSRWGAWYAPLGKSWTRIRGHKTKEQHRNNARRGNGVTTRWGTDEYRLLEYLWVPAGHVREYINDDADFAAAAELATGDHGNYWADVWEHGISTYRDIIRLPDEPSDLEVASHPFEVLFSPRGSDYADDLSETWSESGEAAHVYATEVVLGRVPAADAAVSAFSNYIRAL